MDYKNRIHLVKEKLHKENLDAVLISSVPNIIYLTGFSSFSKEEREAYLLITKNKQFILTDGRYSEPVTKTIPHFELFEISAGINYEKAFSKLKELEKIETIGIEEENITIFEEKVLNKVFSKIQNFNISNLRINKSSDEIEFIKEACNLGDKAFSHVLKTISKGITEKDLAFEIEMFIKKNGAELSFPTIAAFGPGSSIPHYATSDKRLTTNSIILLDFGVKLNNYCSDMTRTIFFGKANDKFQKMYNTVLTAQTKAIEFLNSQLSTVNGQLFGKDIDNIARNHIISEGYPTIPHSLGHGIGLEVHESPRLGPSSKDTLTEEMVFSVEPGIYIPNYGGVRIEDLVTITKKGIEVLTNAPKTLIEV